MNFADAIRPLTVDDFLHRHLSRQYLRIEGERDKFSRLVSWDGLNTVLGTHRFAGRINLVRQQTQIPSETYLRAPDVRHGSTIIPRALEGRLRSGDTLVLTAVDELFESVREIVSSMEQLFHVPVNANLYAAFRRLNGFALHWDTHDTLILQIDGAKHWRVFEPTRHNPTSPRRQQDAVKPTAPPVWEGLLRSGDLLYMPRGWWHVAEPVDEASLHVTVGFDMPKGLDFLTWLFDRLKDADGARLNVPVFGTRDERRAYADALAAVLTAHVNADSLDHYLASVEADGDRTFRPALPDAARELPIDDTTPLALTHGKSFVFEATSPGQIGFWHDGTYWRCGEALKDALGCLRDSPAHSIGDLVTRVPREQRIALRAFLSILIEAGVLSPSLNQQASAVQPIALVGDGS